MIPLLFPTSPLIKLVIPLIIRLIIPVLFLSISIIPIYSCDSNLFQLFQLIPVLAIEAGDSPAQLLRHSVVGSRQICVDAPTVALLRRSWLPKSRGVSYGWPHSLALIRPPIVLFSAYRAGCSLWPSASSHWLWINLCLASHVRPGPGPAARDIRPVILRSFPRLYSSFVDTQTWNLQSYTPSCIKT